MHQIQRYILQILTKCDVARFSQLKRPQTDSNLFSYHLKCLLRDKIIEKAEGGYRLSAKGLGMVDKISFDKFEPRQQPKIITTTFVSNPAGKLLLIQRDKQPFLNKWTTPSGKVHLDDDTLATASRREVHEKTGVRIHSEKHRGDYYLRVYSGEELISSALCHVFTAETNEEANKGKWMTMQELHSLDLMPGTREAIIWLATHKEGRFFEELTIQR